MMTIAGICVIFFNRSDRPFQIRRGDRVAHLICEKIFHPDILDVKELGNT